MASSLLEPFLKGKGIQYAIPSSPEYEDLRAGFVYNDSLPAAIVRPGTPVELQSTVRHCIANGIEFTVRSGGHDLFFRHTVAGAVTIDLRRLDSVTVSPDKKTATLGGGANFAKVLTELAKHNLYAPTGTVTTVGYAGWATLGGYGPACSWAGLGVDQIVGATIVNGAGELVRADDTALKVIRGGGGSAGVIAELTIKVYEAEGLQYGLIAYDTADLANLGTLLRGFFRGYNELLAREGGHIPANLCLTPTFLGIPGMGYMFVCVFTWRGPRDAACEAWIDKVAALGPVQGDARAAVAPATAIEPLQAMTNMILPRIYSHMQSVSVTHWSEDVVEAYVKAAAVLPVTGGGISIHELRECSPSCGPAEKFTASVFPCRQPHIVMELLACGSTPEEEVKTAKWAVALREDLIKAEGILDYSYVSITAPENNSLEKIYGSKAAERKGLKEELDPKGVFKHALPKI